MQARRIVVACMVSATMCAAIAGAQSHGSLSDARTQIDAVNKAHVDAYNSGNITEFVNVYAADAVLMPPNATAFKGLKAISEYWQGGWKQGVRNLKLTTTEFDAHGNMADEIGTYSLDIQPAAGGAVMHDRGKYIVLWKRDTKGQWHWYRDIYNSDLPSGK